MCRTLSEPGGYRCEWGTPRFLNAMVGAGAESVAASYLGAAQTSRAALPADVVAEAKLAMAQVVLSAIVESDEPMPDPRGSLRLGHFWCDLAALIGDACAGAAGATGDLAAAVVAGIHPPILQSVCRGVVKAWLDLLLSTSTTVDVAFVGHLADAIAVDSCRAIRRHPAVRESEKRVTASLMSGVAAELVGQN